MMKAVICVMVKNEHSHISEWIDYNFKVGFEKIYVFEDFGSESHAAILKKYIDAGVVVLEPLESNKYGIDNRKCKDSGYGRTTQQQVFDWFVSYAKENHIADWIGFFDVDEFLMFQPDYSLEALMHEFNDYSGVMLAWLLYNANGHIKTPNCGVVEAYTQHCPIWQYLDGIRWQHKSFINVHKVNGNSAVHEWPNCVHTDYSDNLEHVCYDKAYLAHYYTKSFDEYKERMLKRGNMGNNNRSFDQFFDLNPDMLHLEKELLDSVRFDSCGCDVTYISRKHGLIVGGNAIKILELRNSTNT